MIRTLNHSFRIACQPPPAHSCVSPANAGVGCLRKCKSSILSGLPQAKHTLTEEVESEAIVRTWAG